MLYRATKDDTYLSFGERVIYDISNRTKVACGLAAIENVANGSQQDRMHSFVVSETLPVSPANHCLNESSKADMISSICTCCSTRTTRSTTA